MLGNSFSGSFHVPVWPTRRNPSPRPVFRRNQPGDRQRALDIMLPLVESEEQVASDIYCLVGRIYKDMFQDSHFADTQSRDSSIQWWAKRFIHITHISAIQVLKKAEAIHRVACRMSCNKKESNWETGSAEGNSIIIRRKICKPFK